MSDTFDQVIKNAEILAEGDNSIPYQINHGTHHFVTYRSEIYTDGIICVDRNQSTEDSNAIDGTGNLWASVEVGTIQDAGYAYLLNGMSYAQGWSLVILDMQTGELMLDMSNTSNPEQTYQDAIRLAYDRLQELTSDNRNIHRSDDGKEEPISDMDIEDDIGDDR